MVDPPWLDIDLRGRVAIVTGPTSGLGEETAVQLARRGAHVILACRDISRGAQLADRIEAGGFGGRATPLRLDLADVRSVAAFVADFEARFDALDILVNNAGCSTVLRDGRPSVLDGVEETFLVNHLSHFALTLALLPAIGRGSSHPWPARIVHVSSAAHRRVVGPGGDVSPEGWRRAGWLQIGPGEPALDWLADPQNLASSAQLMQRYALSKLAQLAFSNELDRRLRLAADALLDPESAEAEAEAKRLRALLCGRVVRSNAVHPGLVRTQILREAFSAFSSRFGWAAGVLLGLLARVRSLCVGLDVRAGSLPQLWCAIAPAVDERDVRGSYVVPARRAHGDSDAGVAVSTPQQPWVADRDFGERVWQVSERMVAHALHS